MIRILASIAVFSACIGCILWVASAALSRASERTVTYQYIADALDALSEKPNHVTWQDPDTALVRPFTPGDAGMIGQAMTEAWYALTLAQHTGNADILRDSFSGVAQERAARSVKDAALGGQMVVLAQNARPQFYHMDGSVFQAEVAMLVARYMANDDDLVHFELVEDRAKTTMMNDANGWRIYTHERHAAIKIETSQTGWEGAPMAGINYYPAASPWREFWPAFDEDVIAEDFERIKELGATTVRFFLTTDYFADVDTQKDALNRLTTFLYLAENADLQVVPTLFDLKYTFDPAGWGQDLAMLKAVLPVLAASPAVVMLDIKNEPDLDFEAHGRPQILAWLKTMVTLTRMEASGIPLTIGWSSSEVALELEDLMDVVSYHDYADISTTAARLSDIQSATDRPVMITEIGVSSYNAGLGFPGSANGQADDLGERLDALAAADGVFVWTLHDFPVVDASAIGHSLWVQNLQERFGLLTFDGVEKPAAEVVRQAFDQLLTR